jgi:hypothetical protein
VCEKHVNVALGWLSGGELQMYIESKGKWDDWKCGSPKFIPCYKYRIKPKTQKVVRYVGIIKIAFAGGEASKVIDSVPQAGSRNQERYTWTKVEVDEEV